MPAAARLEAVWQLRPPRARQRRSAPLSAVGNLAGQVLSAMGPAGPGLPDLLKVTNCGSRAMFVSGGARIHAFGSKSSVRRDLCHFEQVSLLRSRPAGPPKCSRHVGWARGRTATGTPGSERGRTATGTPGGRAANRNRHAGWERGRPATGTPGRQGASACDLLPRLFALSAVCSPGEQAAPRHADRGYTEPPSGARSM